MDPRFLDTLERLKHLHADLNQLVKKLVSDESNVKKMNSRKRKRKCADRRTRRLKT